MPAKYISERKTFVNPETGESFEGLLKIEHVERSQFEIVYLMRFCDIFDSIGGKKYKVLKYLLTNRNSENMIVCTQREIAEKTGCSLRTITETLKALKEAKIIRMKTGVIILNPHVLIHGSKKKEDWIFTKFVSFEE